MGGYSSKNPDDYCKTLLEENNPVELKEWLYDGKSTLGEIETNKDSVKLVEEAYIAGAKKIYGVDIVDYGSSGRNTGQLVVVLPSDKEQRKKVLKWSTPIAHSLGFDAYTDVGQEYIFVMLD